MGNSVKPFREESLTIKTTRTTKRKIVKHSSRDMESRKEQPFNIDQKTLCREISFDGTTRVSSFENVRAMSTVIASERLRKTLKSLEKGVYPTMEELQRQLTSVALILDSLSTSEEERFLLSRCHPTGDNKNPDLGECVPKEVQKWLTATFTTQYQVSRNPGRPQIRFKHVICAVKCSLYVEKRRRKSGSQATKHR